MKSGFAGNSPGFPQLALFARNKEQLSLFRLASPSPHRSGVIVCWSRHCASRAPPSPPTKAHAQYELAGESRLHERMGRKSRRGMRRGGGAFHSYTKNLLKYFETSK